MAYGPARSAPMILTWVSLGSHLAPLGRTLQPQWRPRAAHEGTNATNGSLKQMSNREVPEVHQSCTRGAPKVHQRCTPPLPNLTESVPQSDARVTQMATSGPPGTMLFTARGLMGVVSRPPHACRINVVPPEALPWSHLGLTWISLGSHLAPLGRTLQPQRRPRAAYEGTNATNGSLKQMSNREAPEVHQRCTKGAPKVHHAAPKRDQKRAQKRSQSDPNGDLGASRNIDYRL